MRKFLRVAFEAAADFRRHGGTILAASLAYFSLLSLFPLAYMLLYLVSFVVSRDQLGYDFLLKFLQGFLPTLGGELARGIKRIAAQQHLQWVVLPAFAWFGMLVLQKVQYAVDVVFESPRKRHPMLSTAVSAALLGFLAILMVLSYLVTQILTLIVAHAPQIARIDLVAIAAYRFLLSFVLPFVLMLIAVSCLYRYLPSRRPAWRHALIGSAVLTLLWELAKHLFSYYLQSLSVYSQMYGSLLVVVLFLLWVYYSAVLFLYGAAVVHRLEMRATRRPGLRS